MNITQKYHFIGSLHVTHKDICLYVEIAEPKLSFPLLFKNKICHIRLDLYSKSGNITATVCLDDPRHLLLVNLCIHSYLATDGMNKSQSKGVILMSCYVHLELDRI